MMKLGEYLAAYGVIASKPKRYMRYGWWQFEKDCRMLSRIAEPRAIPGDPPTSLYGIPRGGMVVAVRLSYMTGLPIVSLSEITSTTLVVDDIIGSGKTMTEFMAKVLAKRCAVLVSVKDCVSRRETAIWMSYARAIHEGIFVRFPWAPEDEPHN